MQPDGAIPVDPPLPVRKGAKKLMRILRSKRPFGHVAFAWALQYASLTDEEMSDPPFNETSRESVRNFDEGVLELAIAWERQRVTTIQSLEMLTIPFSVVVFEAANALSGRQFYDTWEANAQAQPGFDMHNPAITVSLGCGLHLDRSVVIFGDVEGALQHATERIDKRVFRRAMKPA